MDGFSFELEKHWKERRNTNYPRMSEKCVISELTENIAQRGNWEIQGGEKELRHYDDEKNPHSGLKLCRPHGLVWNARVFSEQSKPLLLLFLYSIWLFPRLASIMCFIGTSRSFFSFCFVHHTYDRWTKSTQSRKERSYNLWMQTYLDCF